MLRPLLGFVRWCTSHNILIASQVPQPACEIDAVEGKGAALRWCPHLGKDLGQSLAIHVEVGSCVPVRGVQVRMAEPLADGSEVRPGFEKMDRRRMPEGMRVHALVGQIVTLDMPAHDDLLEDGRCGARSGRAGPCCPCRAAEPGKAIRDAGRGPAGHATIGSQLFSYVDSVGVKSADRADARQQLPINGNSTLVE